MELIKDDNGIIIKDEQTALVELVLKYRSTLDALNAMQKLGLNLALVISKTHYWENALHYAIQVGDDTPEDIMKKSSILDSTTQDPIITGLQRLINKEKQQSIKLGRQEGISSTKIQIARNLLRQGVIMSVIQGATGLSFQEVDRLKADMKA